MQYPHEMQLMQEQDAALDGPTDDRPWGEQQSQVDWLETRFEGGMFDGDPDGDDLEYFEGWEDE